MPYGENAMKKTKVFEWNEHLKEGCEYVHDDSRKFDTKKTEANMYRV